MPGVKISELNPTFTLNDDDAIVLARPGAGNGSTYKILGSVFGKAADVLSLQSRTTTLEFQTALIDSKKVAKSGDTMTGHLTLNANPVANLHAATKQYVDSQITSAVGSIGKTWADFECAP